jgi:hypothetical protein
VDPENRLVARELERRFEEALKSLESTESEVQAHLQRLPQAMSGPEVTFV